MNECCECEKTNKHKPELYVVVVERTNKQTFQRIEQGINYRSWWRYRGKTSKFTHRFLTITIFLDWIQMVIGQPTLW